MCQCVYILIRLSSSHSNNVDLLSECVWDMALIEYLICIHLSVGGVVGVYLYTLPVGGVTSIFPVCAPLYSPVSGATSILPVGGAVGVYLYALPVGGAVGVCLFDIFTVYLLVGCILCHQPSCCISTS